MVQSSQQLHVFPAEETPLAVDTVDRCLKTLLSVPTWAWSLEREDSLVEKSRRAFWRKKLSGRASSEH